MEILFNDKHIVVAVKPYGVLSEYDEKKPNMPALLKEKLGADEIYPVHRLDRTTCGLMIYAKTAKAARLMSALVQNGELKKEYLAVVEGRLSESSGELCDLLYFDRKKNKSFVVKKERKGVKSARLTYEVITAKAVNVNGTNTNADVAPCYAPSFNNIGDRSSDRDAVDKNVNLTESAETTVNDNEKAEVTLLKIRLFTGRTHQIRVQFASRKHPVAGDRRYGSKIKSENIMLCSFALSFPHPITSVPLSFTYTPKNEYFGIMYGVK